jgi:hypothetical protein
MRLAMYVGTSNPNPFHDFESEFEAGQRPLRRALNFGFGPDAAAQSAEPSGRTPANCRHSDQPPNLKEDDGVRPEFVHGER